MAHLDPPKCVVIFAGYEKPMKQFLQMNPGLERRIPYHYHFAPYSVDDLTKILKIQVDLCKFCVTYECSNKYKLESLF